jgi:pimeloyl-ACP methyl ester carboxylesterase
MKDAAVSPDGIPVTFETHGTGEPALVFVHGWSCDRSYWRGQVGDFAHRHRVVVVDLPGHGESGAGREKWTMAAFGADVAAVVDNLGLKDVVLIGHSMGGDVVVETALLLPERVSGLVWVDVYSTLDEDKTPEELEAFVAPFREDFATTTREFVRQRLFAPSSDADLVEWVAADMSAAPPEVAVDAMMHSIANASVVVNHLREMSAPVVAINPDHRPTDVDGLRRHGVETVLMERSAHFLMLEDPVTFNRLLDETVERFITAR